MRKKVINNPNKGLFFLYNTYIGRILLTPLVKNNFISNIVGKYMNSKLSKIIIKPFIKSNNINIDDYVNTNYNSFNEFFIRKIKKEKRVIPKDENLFLSPCDSKLTCYKINKNTIFKIKNSTYTVDSILSDKNLSLEYKNGYALVFRLSPDDYHRYMFISNGTILNNYKIDGKFHTVNPISYNRYKVFKENKRECTVVDTKNFGIITYVEVGALLVGRIKNLITNGNVKRGMEKGYFEYGGSTIVIFVKENEIKIDNDIINNSKNGYETYVKYGEKIGKKL